MLPTDVRNYLLTYRPTIRSMLRGFMQDIPSIFGPGDQYGFISAEFTGIPGCHIEFRVQHGRVVCAFVQARGAVMVEEGESAFTTMCLFLEQSFPGVRTINLDVFC